MTSENVSQVRPLHRRRGLIGWMIAGVVILALLAFVVAPILIFAFFVHSVVVTGPYYGFPFFFPLGFFLFLIVAFVAFRLIFWGWGWGWRGGYGRGGWGYGNAKEILRRRYARGEITKEQFDQMKKDLDES
jgi:putative membrane protein